VGVAKLGEKGKGEQGYWWVQWAGKVIDPCKGGVRGGGGRGKKGEKKAAQLLRMNGGVWG